MNFFKIIIPIPLTNLSIQHSNHVLQIQYLQITSVSNYVKYFTTNGDIGGDSNARKVSRGTNTDG